MANQRVLFGGLKVMGALLVTGMLVVACGDDDGGDDGGSTGGSTSTGGGAGETGTGGGTDTGGSGTTGGAANTGGSAEGGAGGMGGSGTGGSASSPECATYCTGTTGVVQVCGATLAAENPFDNEGDCLTQCAAQSNWDLACRQDHLDNVIDDPNQADFHCPHTIGQNGYCEDS